MHDHGNEENFFDRMDFKPSVVDTHQHELRLHALLVPDAQFVRRPGRYGLDRAGGEQRTVIGPNGQPVGSQDQRSQDQHVQHRAHLDASAQRPHGVHRSAAFARQDQYNYYPSSDPFADLQPDLQLQTIGQNRTLTNLGLRASMSYVKGIHNMKIGDHMSWTRF